MFLPSCDLVAFFFLRMKYNMISKLLRCKITCFDFYSISLCLRRNQRVDALYAARSFSDPGVCPRLVTHPLKARTRFLTKVLQFYSNRHRQSGADGDGGQLLVETKDMTQHPEAGITKFRKPLRGMFRAGLMEMLCRDCLQPSTVDHGNLIAPIGPHCNSKCPLVAALQPSTCGPASRPHWLLRRLALAIERDGLSSVTLGCMVDKPLDQITNIATSAGHTSRRTKATSTARAGVAGDPPECAHVSTVTATTYRPLPARRSIGLFPVGRNTDVGVLVSLQAHPGGVIGFCSHPHRDTVIGCR